jgi:hypothetical protein
VQQGVVGDSNPTMNHWSHHILLHNSRHVGFAPPCHKGGTLDTP